MGRLEVSVLHIFPPLPPLQPHQQQTLGQKEGKSILESSSIRQEKRIEKRERDRQKKNEATSLEMSKNFSGTMYTTRALFFFSFCQDQEGRGLTNRFLFRPSICPSIPFHQRPREVRLAAFFCPIRNPLNN